MEMCSTNQLLAERLVEQKILVDKKASETAPQPEPELIPDLDPIDFAARRLFDGLASEAEGEETLLEKATTLSMLCRARQVVKLGRTAALRGKQGAQ